MIRLFLSDIDGCLSEPFTPFDLDGLARVRAAVQAGGAAGQGAAPAVTLLTGRAFAYAEAYAQLLATHAPVFFESGAGLFDREHAQVRWHPTLTPAIEEALAEVRAWFFAHLLREGVPIAFDYGKRTQVGVVSPDPAVLAAAVAETRAFVSCLGAPLQVFATPVSVDVVPLGLAKTDALPWIAEVTGVSLAEMAFIGDSEGDVGALQEVGTSFAPANATARVKAAVQRVMPSPGLAGVHEAYAEILAMNA